MSPEEIKREIENSHSLVYDRDGNVIYFYYYKGIPLPAAPTIPSVISTIQNFTLREDDIFLCAYPLCNIVSYQTKRSFRNIHIIMKLTSV